MWLLYDVQAGGLLPIAGSFELCEAQVVEHGADRLRLGGVNGLNEGDDPAERVEGVVELDGSVVGPFVALVPQREHQVAATAGQLAVERASLAVGDHPRQE